MKEGQPVWISFVCQKEQVEQVQEVFHDQKLGTLSPEVTPIINFLDFAHADTDIPEVAGVEVVGLIAKDKTEAVVGALAVAQIAAYSRETMLSFPDKEIVLFSQEGKWSDEAWVYKPEIDLRANGIIVKFSEALYERPGEGKPRAQTAFLISHDRPIWPEIGKLPEHLLRKLSDGIRLHLEDDEYLDEQKAVLTESKKQFDEFIDAIYKNDQ